MSELKRGELKDKVAVITPYYKESTEVLRFAHDSVMAQGYGVDHFMIADGHPKLEVQKWNIKHTTLPTAHADNGNTPRFVGSMLAKIAGYKYIAYLDADNWYHPDHITSLKQLIEKTNAPIAASRRTFHALDGAILAGVTGVDEDTNRHVDTSCYLIHRDAFSCISLWSDMPTQLSPLCDRVFLVGIRQKNFQIAFSMQRSVAFRSQYAIHYQMAGLQPPLHAKQDVSSEPLKWLRTIDGVRLTTRQLGFYPF